MFCFFHLFLRSQLSTDHRKGKGSSCCTAASDPTLPTGSSGESCSSIGEAKHTLALKNLSDPPPHRTPLHSGQAGYHTAYLLRRIMGPCKLLGRPKALVSQSHCCVDDILAITTNHNKPRKHGSQEGN